MGPSLSGCILLLFASLILDLFRPAPNPFAPLAVYDFLGAVSLLGPTLSGCVDLSRPTPSLFVALSVSDFSCAQPSLSPLLSGLRFSPLGVSEFLWVAPWLGPSLFGSDTWWLWSLLVGGPKAAACCRSLFGVPFWLSFLS